MTNEKTTAERMSMKLRAAIRLGDSMSERIADHSLRLRRLKRAVQTALHLLEVGRPQKAKEELHMAMLAEWKLDDER
jgi:hypothetical protein